MPCSENVDLISSEHSSFLLLFFTQGDHLGQDRDHSAMKFYLFVLTELIHSAFALVMGSDRDHSVVRFYLSVLKELIHSLFAFVMLLFLSIWGRSPSIDLMG